MLYSILPVLVLLGFASRSFARHVYFEVTFSWGAGAPDGQVRDLIYINGQFPGPPFVLDYGDDVEFVLHNQLPEASTVHFHGIEQLGTPWSDGVPGVSQKPVAPGGSFTYRWKATQWGTYWYHGHAQGQIQDGAFGALHIRPPPNAKKPFSQLSNSTQDLATIERAEQHPHLVLLSDWSRLTAAEYLAAEQASGLDIFCVDSMLINGKGSVNCQPQSLLNKLTPPPLLKLLNGSFISDKGCTPPSPKALSVGNFTGTDIGKIPSGVIAGCTPSNGSQEIIEVNAADGYASIHWISTMSIKTPVVSIDEHPMTVFAVDGQYIVPQPAETIFMYNGERYSAIVKLDKPAGDYTIRLANSGADQIISAYATLRVRNGTSPSPSGTYENSTGVSVSSTGEASGSPTRGHGDSYGGHGDSPRGRGSSSRGRGRHQARDVSSDTSPPKATSSPYILYNGMNITASVVPLDLTKIVPFPATKPCPTADATHFMNLVRLSHNWGWTLSGKANYPDNADYGTPLLFHSNSKDANNGSLIIRTNNGTWVDIVLQVVLNGYAPAQPAHPIHKHSNKAYIIGAGDGIFNYTNVAEAMKVVPGSFNLETPSLRDSFTTPSVLRGPAWVVFRYQVVNPGAFYVHCHISTHLTGGMAMTIMDGVDAWPEIPTEYQIAL